MYWVLKRLIWRIFYLVFLFELCQNIAQPLLVLIQITIKSVEAATLVVWISRTFEKTTALVYL